MAEGHGGGGACRAGSNHRVLVSTTWRVLKPSPPPYPKRGASSRTYFAVYW